MVVMLRKYDFLPLGVILNIYLFFLYFIEFYDFLNYRFII